MATILPPERRCSSLFLGLRDNATAELRSRNQETPFGILQKGGVPAAPSGTATLLRLSPNRERIHRAMADARLLANPASWGRVADPSPN